jgi:hypothetical protein
MRKLTAIIIEKYELHNNYAIPFRQLLLAFSGAFRRRQLLSMRVERISHGLKERCVKSRNQYRTNTDLYALVVKFEAIADPSSKDFANLDAISTL